MPPICPMRAEGSAHKLDYRRLLRRTSISSIPTGIQRLCAISKVTGERSCSSRASPRKECRHVLGLDPEAFNSICRSRCGKWGLVRLAFTSNGVRSKQSGRFDLAFALARTDRSSATCKSRRPPERGSVGVGARAGGSGCATRSRAAHLPRLLIPSAIIPERNRV